MNADPQNNSPDHLDTGSDRSIPENHPFTRLLCLSCGESHSVPKYCGDRFCPVCSGGRRYRIRTRLDDFLQQLKLSPGERLSHIVLTLKNQPVLDGMADFAIKSFRKLRQRKFWKNFITGGCTILEITGSAGDWHVHLHIIAQAHYLPQAYLLEQWRAIVGKGGVFIKTASKGQLVWYLTKYLTQSGDEEIDRAASEALKDYRLFQPFGAWHGNIPKFVPVPFPCSNCGKASYMPEDAILKLWPGFFTETRESWSMGIKGPPLVDKVMAAKFEAPGLPF